MSLGRWRRFRRSLVRYDGPGRSRRQWRVVLPRGGLHIHRVAHQRWTEVQRLFDELIELVPVERSQRLDQLARADADVAREVSALIDASDRAGDFLHVLESPSVRPTPQPRAAQRVAGRYRVVRLIGRGATGEVFLARDEQLERAVALKFLPPLLGADPSLVKRFVAEARAAARLDHPHVVPVYDIGEAGPQELFIAMAYYAGGPLSDRIARRPLPLSEALRVGAELADGLAAAHAAGIVHRDVKPANVLFDAEGAAKIADFGVAKLPGHNATGPGVLIGTLAYMSPEQARAEDVDARADLWALGVVTYEMITGARPFGGDNSAAVLQAILSNSPETLRSRRDRATQPWLEPPDDALLADVQGLIDSLLQKDPSKRLASAAEARRRFGALAGRAGVVSSSAGVASSIGALRGRADRPGARKTMPLWRQPLGVLAIVALLAGAVALTGVIRSRGRDSADAISRVVIAPFENRTGDASLDAVGSIVADWLAQGLTETQLLRVVDVQAALRSTRGADAAVDNMSASAALAKARDAGTLVAGRYYLVGDSVQFQAEIIDAQSGSTRHVLAPVRAARRDPTPALDPLRQRVLGALASDVDPRLASWGQRTARPPTYAAYLEFVEGLEAMWEYSYDFPKRALLHFQRATAHDSTYFKARLLAARMHTLLGQSREADSLVRSLQAVRSQLDPWDQAYLDRVAATLAGDHSAALIAARRIYAISPDGESAWILAREAMNSNRAAEAVRVLEATDPSRYPEMSQSPVYWLNLVLCYHVLGEHQKELDVARDAAKRFPDRLSAASLQMWALAALGRQDELEERLAGVMALPPERGITSIGDVITTSAGVMRAQGHTHGAEPLLRRAEAWCRARPERERDEVLTREPCERGWIMAGRFADADSVVTILAREFPDSARFRSEVGVLAALRGDRATAETVERELAAIPRPPLVRDVLNDPPYVRARIAAALGDAPTAVKLLRDAGAEGVGMAFLVEQDPAFDPIRHSAPLRELFTPQQ